MTKKLTGTLFAALALASVPAFIAPTAQAEVCGEVGGRHVAVSDCGPGLVGLGVDAAVAGAAVGAGDWARYGWDQAYPYSVYPAFPGEAPCISPAGLPYYTPGDAPCYP